jgi:hypothetical protein
MGIDRMIGPLYWFPSRALHDVFDPDPNLA